MEDIDVLKHIREILKEKNWSNYKLAKESKLSKEGLNKMLRENHIPSMNSLIKICNGFNITLSQFFSEIETPNDEHTQLINLWRQLTPDDKYHVKVYISGLLKKQATLNITNERGDDNDI